MLTVTPGEKWLVNLDRTTEGLAEVACFGFPPLSRRNQTTFYSSDLAGGDLAYRAFL